MEWGSADLDHANYHLPCSVGRKISANMQCYLHTTHSATVRLYLLHYGVPRYIYQGLVKAREGWAGNLTARRRDRPLLETASYFSVAIVPCKCGYMVQWLGRLRHSRVAVVGLGSAARQADMRTGVRPATLPLQTFLRWQRATYMRLNVGNWHINARIRYMRCVIVDEIDQKSMLR